MKWMVPFITVAYASFGTFPSIKGPRAAIIASPEQQVRIVISKQCPIIDYFNLLIYFFKLDQSSKIHDERNPGSPLLQHLMANCKPSHESVEADQYILLVAALIDACSSLSKSIMDCRHLITTILLRSVSVKNACLKEVFQYCDTRPSAAIAWLLADLTRYELMTEQQHKANYKFFLDYAMQVMPSKHLYNALSVKTMRVYREPSAAVRRASTVVIDGLALTTDLFPELHLIVSENVCNGLLQGLEISNGINPSIQVNIVIGLQKIDIQSQIRQKSRSFVGQPFVRLYRLVLDSNTITDFYSLFSLGDSRFPAQHHMEIDLTNRLYDALYVLVVMPQEEKRATANVERIENMLRVSRLQGLEGMLQAFVNETLNCPWVIVSVIQ